MQKIHIIINVVLLLLLLSSFAGLGFLSYRLGSTIQQLGQCRTELAAAADRQQDALDTINECYRNVTRTAEVLSESITTVQDIKRQLREIRENYEAMENRLHQFYDNNNNPDSDTNSIKEN